MTTRTIGDSTVVKITDNVLDGESVRRLRLHASEPGRRRLRLDCRHVELVTASGLGQLLDVHKCLQSSGRRLTLIHVCLFVYEVFEVTHLTKVLDVRPARL